MSETMAERAQRAYDARAEDLSRILEAFSSDDEDTLDESAYDEACQFPLSVELLTVSLRNETCEWEILLGTGGPADRIRIVTDFSGNIEEAVYEFQDWFEPWTKAPRQDEKILTQFAEVLDSYAEWRELL